MNPVDIRHLINAIDNSTYEPNKWERNFLKTMRDYILAGKYASQKQSNTLQHIYRKAQGSEKPVIRERL